MCKLNHSLTHFYPRPVLAFGYCRCLRLCVCPCVCQSVCQSWPVQARITKFGPKMQKTMVKVPIVLRDNWPWPSRSNLTWKWEVTPFWASPYHNSLTIQARTTKFGPEVQNSLVKIPIVLGVDWASHVKFNLFSKSCLFASLLRLWNICETCINIWKRSLFHILNGCAHSVVSWTMKQSSCIFSVTVAGFPVLDSAIGNGFLMLLHALAKLYIPHMPKFCVPTFGNGRNNTKPRAFAFIMSYFWHVLGNPVLFLAPT